MSLEEYDVLRVVGRGTYGEVHLVVHKKDKKQYVVKKLALVKVSAKERKAAELEAKLLSNLRHPNIVSYKDSFESESGHLYIVMGFAEGGDLYTTLRERRDKKDYLTEQQTVRWYIQICMALQYLHDRRILHRDLKTQNIFLTKTKMIKVGDLGIAKVLESANDMATTLIGTPYYMSPELFSNQPYNQKSDVWALGCCMYEMVTLKHAFNAKDINSLMYKILKGKMPPMPEEYSDNLCGLIKEMLNQKPEKRPSVNKILRNPFVKVHIQLFLDESSRRRRPASDRSSRKSSVASSGAGSRPTSSRKASANSQGSSPSPRPPLLAPDSSKPPRARSPNLKSPSKGAVSPSERKRENDRAIENDSRRTDVPNKPKSVDSDSVRSEDPKRSSTGDTSNCYPGSKVKTHSPKPQNVSPRVLRQVDNENTNNSKVLAKPNDSGIYVNYVEPPRYENVEIHQRSEAQNESKPNSASSEKRRKEPRASSASSSCSTSSQASSSSTRKNRRALPECPEIAPSLEPERKERPSCVEKLQCSGESVTSVASSVVSTATENGAPRQISSARQRRRERLQKEKAKTPAIVEEIRKSRSTGFKKALNGNNRKSAKSTRVETEEKPLKNEVFSDAPDGALGDAQPPTPRSREGSQALGELEQLQQPEVEEFMTLLHTTLHLGSEKEPTSSEEGDSPILAEEQRGELSPVPELSESSSSSATNQSHPYSRNTPAATPINVPSPSPRVYSDAKQGISKGTLRSTQRLMDRIISLRKDCILGLGVPLLHRAYEVLDENENDDVLQEELVALLGPVRFEQWAGKIWQLKYCEESMFGHCDTITAF